MQKSSLSNNLHLHFIVLILGFTAILGKLISIEAASLVWYRTLIAVAALLVFFLLKRQSVILPARKMMTFLAVGVIVGLHWFCFFHAIKVSNVSVTLGCLSVTTLFTSLLEPLFGKRRISALEVILGLVIIFGIYIIFRFETRYIEGIVFTIAAAFLASLFSVINKNLSESAPVEVISVYELSGALITISILLLFNNNSASFLTELLPADYLWLLLLGTVCTAYAFSATIAVMKKLSAFHVVLAINLEPVYGILAAFLIFGASEYMSGGFYSGALIILAAVFFYPLLRDSLKIFNGNNRKFPLQQWPPAALWKRAVALLIDLFVFCLFFFPIAYIIKGVWLMGPEDHLWVIFDPICAVYLVVMVCYYIFTEAWLGGSIGKLVLGLRIVRANGEIPGLKASLLRNAARMVDGILMHSVGYIIARKSPQRQRLGDKWAGTYVISSRQKS